MKLYIIRYSNYEPAEIGYIFLKKENAEKKLSEIGGMWKVDEWETDDNEFKCSGCANYITRCVHAFIMESSDCNKNFEAYP